MKLKSLLVVFSLVTASHVVLAQWTKINFPSQFSIKEMIFVNDSVGYVIADSIIGLNVSGKAFKTFDGGLHWYEKTFYYQSFQHIHFYDEMHGWISMNDGQTTTLRRTTDGGNTWINVSFNAPDGPLYFVNAQQGFSTKITSNGATLFQSMDGGISWSSTGINIGLSAINDIYCSNGSQCVTAGLYGPTLGVSNTLTGTYTSFSQSLSTYDFHYNDVQNVFYIVAEDIAAMTGGLYMVPAGGSPINLVYNGVAQNKMFNCVNSRNLLVLAGATDGSGELSTDGGSTWTTENINATTTIMDVYVGNTFMIAAAGEGEIYRKPLSTSVNEDYTAPNMVSYPNPANDWLAIQSIDKQSTITIYDMNGKDIFSSANDGKNSYLISTVSWPQGIYTAATTMSNGMKHHQKIAILH